MNRPPPSWGIVWRLEDRRTAHSVAQGHIKDYPSSAEALERLGERIQTAITAELRNVLEPAPWALTLAFTITCDPHYPADTVEGRLHEFMMRMLAPPSEDLGQTLEMPGVGEQPPASAEDSGLDLS